jgi:tetratricopeptide (TPR) repeat protein
MARLDIRWIFAGLLCLSIARSGTAQNTAASPFAGTPFTSTAAELRNASAAVPADREYGAQIFYEESIYRIGADGALRYQHRMLYRVDSEGAVKGWAEVSARWDPWYENQAQIHARVLQPDGSFVELDQKTITDAPVSAEDDETFSSEHVRRAPLPGMAIGSIIEEQEETQEKIPYFSAGALYRSIFRENVPLGRMRVVVELPAAMPFKEAVHDLPQLSIARSEAGGMRHIVYEAANLPPSHDSDIDLATNAPTTPMVEFATGASWAAIASTYAAMAEPQIAPSEAQTILPKDLPSDRLARIRAIVKQLHHEVRYTGVEFGSAKLTPQKPLEVLQRHYGDCKDKATLLVAMLRAAGIDADLALLATGPGRDVVADLPGISRFDHAIVYVPGTGSAKPIWIDATAEFFAVDTLPYADQGRNALVVAKGTAGLTRTPDPTPEDSVLVETRTFTLKGLGPAQLEETSETHGYIDANYRSNYGGPETPKMHEEMETYVKNTYLAKKLVKFEHGDGADFERPFTLSLTADGAKRASSSLVDAVAVVFPTTTVNNLPKWFSTRPASLAPDLSDEQKRELALQEKSRPATFAVRPYIYETRTRVLYPAGFELRALPPNKTTQLGTATLTESYNSEPGAVMVTFRFNSGPSQLTVEQALAMRDAVLELNKRDYVGIFLDQSGAKELTAGHIRAALDIDRKLISANSSDPLQHMRLARVLLEAGIGGEAQAEARHATELDPKLSAAAALLGWTLEHNALGERFGKGFDLAASVAAYKKAIELDPEDNDPRFDLAILYEFNARGERYSADADLPASIKTYQDLIDMNKAKGDQAAAQYRENQMYALLYARRFAELDTMIASLPSTNAHRILAITSAAAQHGAPAGIAQADKGNVASSDRNKNLRSAGTQLANLHLYAEAAEIVTAGMQGGEDAAAAARQVELYRGLKPASLAPLPPNNPAAPFQTALIGTLAGTLDHDKMAQLVSHHAYSSQQSMELDIKRGLATVGFMRRLAEKSDMTESVLLDLIAGNTTFSTKGDDEHGWSVLAQTPGSEASHAYVVKEDGAYRMVADDKDNAAMGNEVLYALDHGNAVEAKAMLDWKRDLTHKRGGDDPYDTPLLPLFWTVGSSKPGADSPAAMRLAALSLLAGSMDAKPYLDEIAALREKATGQRQTDLDLLLAVAAMGAEQPALGAPAAKRLLEQEPDSVTALDLAGQGYLYQNNSKDWLAMLAPRLARKPEDHDLLSAQAHALELTHDFKGARAALQKVLDSGKATSNDYNSYAWSGLFDDHLGEDTLKAAQQSAQMAKNASFGSLHTLACVDAAQGKTTEARQVLNQAMSAGNQVEPNSEVWYALGLIYEQYGAKAAALDAYRRVQAHEMDDHIYIDPASTYLLAQARMKALAN